MLEYETDEKYNETYISYLTFKLQKHIIEYKENRSWILKCYKLWLRACILKSLNPKITIYQKDQMKNENVYYFIRKKYDFKEDEVEVQKQLEEVESSSRLLQTKLIT
jgi:hypothetical protein